MNELKIIEILEGSQAEQIGLKLGDICLEYNSSPVATNAELAKAIQVAKNDGLNKSEILIKRDDKKFTVCVSPAKKLGAGFKELENIALPQNASNYRSKSNMGNFILFLVLVVGWLSVALGVIGSISFFSTEGYNFYDINWVNFFPSFFLLVSGFLLIIAVQVAKATKASADYNKKLLDLVINNLDD